MPEKLTYAQAKEWFESIGLTLLSSDYIGIDKPMKCQDGEGYLYSRTLHTVIQMANRPQAKFNQRFSIKNQYFWENVQHFMALANTATTLVSSKQEYHGDGSRLMFCCGNCHGQYVTTWRNFVRADHKICFRCYRAERMYEDCTEATRTPMSIYRQRAATRGLTILDPRIDTNKANISVQDIDGYRGRMTASRLLSGSSFEKFSVRNPFSIYNLRVYAKSREWDCTIPDQRFKGTEYPVEVICSCGKRFKLNVSHFLEGKYRCKSCRRLSEFIDSHQA